MLTIGQTYGSKVTILFRLSRWWPPPSWISSGRKIWRLRKAERYRTYLAFKFLWKSVKWFKSNSTFTKFTMVAAAILDFVTLSSSIKPSRGMLQHLLVFQILWDSVTWLKSYSTFSKLKMAVAAILNFVTMSILTKLHVARYSVCLSFKIGENRSSGLKVTVLFPNSRWRPSPSWISS